MRTMLKMALATVAFAAIHSALATRKTKDVAARLVGERRRDAGYRVFFVAQATLGFAALAAYGACLPRRTLYRVRGPGAWLLRLGQAIGAFQLLAGLREVGFMRWSGLRNLLAGRRGRTIPQGPAAQGPEMAEDNRLTTGGPFRHSRHPLNFSGIPALWLTPHLTSRRLAFNLVGTAYLFAGSLHEEARLRSAYGHAYSRYTKEVPFFWSFGKRRRAPGIEVGHQEKPGRLETF